MSERIFLLLLFLVYPEILQAQYHDPGSVSVIYQLLLFMLTFTIFYFKRIISFLSNIVKRIRQKQNNHE